MAFKNQRKLHINGKEYLYTFTKARHVIHKDGRVKYEPSKVVVLFPDRKKITISTNDLDTVKPFEQILLIDSYKK